MYIRAQAVIRREMSIRALLRVDLSTKDRITNIWQAERDNTKGNT